ncbi:GNAT family N-acetyltransferase [Paenibacillus pabuli]|uniref:GNAT family N-acetyltransferase n=1 Tax=Paenibacillus pabuli TaxID=1472 RepID=UPI003242CD46
MITELQTERLQLRKMQVSDSPALFKIWSDPEVTRFMNVRCFTAENQAIEMIQLLDDLSQDNKAIRFSIIHKESGEIIGSCGYNAFNFANGTAEIGYDLAKSYWGKGYASEAVSSLVDYAFSSWKLKRIEAKVDPRNLNSIKLLQKLDFSFEGTLKKTEGVEEAFNDLHLYLKSTI